MLAAKVIYKNDAKDLVLSPVYTVPKKDSKKRRFVMNLRWINRHLRTEHFKMTTMKDVKSMITKNAFMTKLDLKDCYWQVPVCKEDQRFLSFRWRGVNYSFNSLPFGLSVSPWFVTKLFKPVIAQLQQEGFSAAIYIDDLILVGKNQKECAKATRRAVALLTELGVILNLDKSDLHPSQVVEYLGFELDSRKMMIRAPPKKIKNVKTDIKKFLNRKKSTARQAASVIGKIGALSEALFPTRVHMAHIQQWKLHLLTMGWDHEEAAPQAAREELQWWLEHLKEMNGMSLLPIKCEVAAGTDASDNGWGAWIQPDNGEKQSFGGFFPKEVLNQHINYKELLAIKLLLLSSEEKIRGKTISIGTDNITTMYYANRMGGRKFLLTKLATEIWSILDRLKAKIRVEFVPGRLNSLADKESRKELRLSDMKLNVQLFQQVDRQWGPHTIDLFASWENRQVDRFASWQPSPQATWVDALAHQWKDENGWAHPPFSMITQVLQKVKSEKTVITLVAPWWPAQPWFSMLLDMATEFPIWLIPPSNQHLLIAHKSATPAWATLAWRLSGSSSRGAASRIKFLKALRSRGNNLQLRSTSYFGNSGPTTVGRRARTSSRRIPQRLSILSRSW